MATISLELLENVGFVNKSQLWLVEPKIPGTRYTEAYQLHGHTPIAPYCLISQLGLNNDKIF